MNLWQDSLRRQRVRAGKLRSAQEVQQQYEAAQAFAPAVFDLSPVPHQYSAGQAAALAWLNRSGPAPLTFGVTGEVGGAYSVQRLEEWASELLERDGGLFPRPYVIGVNHVCRWVQRTTDVVPFPPVDPRGATWRTAGLRIAVDPHLHPAYRLR